MKEPVLTVPLDKAWSDSARKAAQAARELLAGADKNLNDNPDFPYWSPKWHEAMDIAHGLYARLYDVPEEEIRKYSMHPPPGDPMRVHTPTSLRLH